MNNVGIKTYRLDQFPSNAKLTNQGDRIKRFELTYNESDQIYYRLMQEIRNVYNEESDRAKVFKLYWKDEENDLILIANDSDFRTALENNNSGDVIKVYIVDEPMTSNQFNGQTSNITNDSKRNQTHPGITCNACNSKINGLRYKCKNCSNYSICDECKKKKVHFNSHTFEIIESKYGFLTCLDCEIEMPNSFNVCKDCPIGNTLLGIYPTCNNCKEKHHKDHSCLNIKTSDLNRLRQKLLDDLENQVNKDEESKVYYGIKCYGCKRDGCSYRSTSFKCENVCLCIDCFIQGIYLDISKSFLQTYQIFNYIGKSRMQYIRGTLCNM